MTVPQLVISIRPIAPTILKGLFDSGAESITAMLERPTVFRRTGWSIETLDQARIVAGDYLEVSNGERKTIRAYEDGTFLARVNADASFLGWGQDEAEFQRNPKLNPLAAIEFLSSCIYFYAQLIPHLAKRPKELGVHLELIDAKVNQRFLYTVAGELHSFAWLLPDAQYALTTDKAEKDVTIATDDVVGDPSHAAYLVVEKLFLLFGISPNSVPYVVEAGGKRRIDIDKIAKM